MQNKEPEPQTDSYFLFLTNLESRLGIVGLSTNPSDLEVQLGKTVLVLDRLSQLQEQLPKAAQTLPFFKTLQKNIKFLGYILPALNKKDINHSSLFSFASHLQPLPFTDYTQIYWIEQIFDANTFTIEFRKKRVIKLALALQITNPNKIDNLIDSISALLKQSDQPRSKKLRLQQQLAFRGCSLLTIALLLTACIAPPPVNQATMATVIPSAEEAVLMKEEATTTQNEVLYYSAGAKKYLFKPEEEIVIDSVKIIPDYGQDICTIINHNFSSLDSQSQEIKVGREGNIIKIRDEGEKSTFIRIIRLDQIYNPEEDSFMMMIIVEEIIAGSISDGQNLPLVEDLNPPIINDGVVSRHILDYGSRLQAINITIPYDINRTDNYYEETVEICGRHLTFIFSSEYSGPRVFLNNSELFFSNGELGLLGTSGEIVVLENVGDPSNYLFSATATIIAD